LPPKRNKEERELALMMLDPREEEQPVAMLPLEASLEIINGGRRRSKEEEEKEMANQEMRE